MQKNFCKGMVDLLEEILQPEGNKVMKEKATNQEQNTWQNVASIMKVKLDSLRHTRMSPLLTAV